MNTLQLDRLTINGFIENPENKQGPGVLVLHAWWGLNEFIHKFCQRLAKEGFFVIAPDLYDGKVADTIKQAEEYVNKVDGAVVKPLLLKTVDFLKNHDNCSSLHISVIGFSFGASWAGWLANNKPTDIEKTVLFYGTGETNFAHTKAAFLCHFAENDPYEEPKYVKVFLDSLRSAGIQVSEYVYPNTHHWFFESDKTEYFNQEAATLAWERTLIFLNS